MKGGMTALMCAANMGHQETAQKLIQSGAGVDATNKVSMEGFIIACIN